MPHPFTEDAVAFGPSTIFAPLFDDAGTVTATPPIELVRELQTNYQFIDMLNAYRSSGGLARAQEVSRMCGARGAMQGDTLASHIARRKVVSLEWQGEVWLPLFQFSPQDMGLMPGLNDVLAELVTALDDWDIAHWFSRPNPWLADRTPADALAMGSPGVLNAARAECHVARG